MHVKKEDGKRISTRMKIFYYELRL